MTITDAILIGEEEGPLRTSPEDLGIMSRGFNVAALDLAHSHFMGFDPSKNPLVRNAFQEMIWPLVDFAPGEVRVSINGKTLSDLDAIDSCGRSFGPPKGWTGHLEKRND